MSDGHRDASWRPRSTWDWVGVAGIALLFAISLGVILNVVLAQDSAAPDLADQVEFTFDECSPPGSSADRTGAWGTVRNDNEQAVEVSVRVMLLTGDGSVVADRADNVTVPGGETAPWAVPHNGPEFTDCELVDVSVLPEGGGEDG